MVLICLARGLVYEERRKVRGHALEGKEGKGCRVCDCERGSKEKGVLCVFGKVTGVEKGS